MYAVASERTPAQIKDGRTDESVVGSPDVDSSLLARHGGRDTGRAMSQENVEDLRRCFAIANERGIGAAVDAFGHLLDEEFGLEEAADMPDRDRYQGKDAFIANLKKLGEDFEELRIEPLEFVDLGEKLVVVVSMAGRGRASGAPVELTFAQLWTLREGKAVSLHDYASKAEALEAVRLRE